MSSVGTKERSPQAPDAVNPVNSPPTKEFIEALIGLSIAEAEARVSSAGFEPCVLDYDAAADCDWCTDQMYKLRRLKLHVMQGKVFRVTQ